MASNLKLVYFDIRGRAEMLRLVLAAAGKEYEEERVQFADWPAKKSTTPYGALPYIVYNGKVYGQSIAIGPFLAKEFGFFGKTNEDELRILEVTGLWEDELTGGLIKYRWGKTEEDKAAARKRTLEEDLPKFFGYYEKFLEENGRTGYIVGNSLTLADFYIYDMADNMLQLKKDALKDYPLVQKLRQNVEANPKVKAYLKSRKETVF